MNRLIRLILYITAGCVGIGCASLILSLALSGGHLNWKDEDIFQRVKQKAQDFAEPEIGHGEEWQDQNDRHQLDAIEYADAEVTVEEGEEREDAAIGVLTVDSSGIEDLSIDLKHAYLSIQPSEDSRIQVFCQSQEDAESQIKASCEAGAITIADTRKGKNARKDITVCLKIPDHFKFNTAQIQISAGEVDAGCGILSDHLTVNAGAGLISLGSPEADILHASVGAGEIDMEDGVFRSVFVDCGVGMVDMQADITEYAKIDCGMGEVDLELVQGIQSANYTLKCGVGSIDIGDSSYSGLSRETRLQNGALAEFELNCGMGAISVDND